MASVILLHLALRHGFSSAREQREHHNSDLSRYNASRKRKGRPPITEVGSGRYRLPRHRMPPPPLPTPLPLPPPLPLLPPTPTPAPALKTRGFTMLWMTMTWRAMCSCPCSEDEFQALLDGDNDDVSSISGSEDSDSDQEDGAGGRAWQILPATSSNASNELPLLRCREKMGVAPRRAQAPSPAPAPAPPVTLAGTQRPTQIKRLRVHPRFFS